MRVAKPLLAPALGLALSLLTLEGVSRSYFNYRSIRDPVLGSVVAAGHTFRSRIEGSGVGYHEDHGVRRAPDLGPRSGARILCVGDSYTEAHQVSDDEVYTTLVERSLDRSGMPAAVLNIGRSGLSVADYVVNSQAFKEATSPTWTVVQIHDLDFYSDTWQTSKTHFRRRCSACPIEAVRIAPVPDDTVRRTMRWLRNQSALVGFGMHRWQELAGVSRRNSQPSGAEEHATATLASTVDFPVTEELRMLARAYDGRLTLLLLGRFDPAHPGRDTDEEAVITRAARELGISLACSKDEYPALAQKGIAPHGFPNTSLNSGHMNAAGHAAAARVLTRELLRLHAEGRI